MDMLTQNPCLCTFIGEHSDKTDSDAIEKEIKSRTCPICSYVFKNRNSMNTHKNKKICSSEPKHDLKQCKKCLKQFSTSETRRVHEKRNTCKQVIIPVVPDKKRKGTKRSVGETKKKYVASKQSWKCGDCQEELTAWFEVDHTVRLEDGGGNDVDNLVALCRNCHGKKTAFENMSKC